MVTVKPLGDLCRITLGQSPSSTSYNQNEEGLPFFQGNADFGVDHPVARTWCTEPKKIAQPGDLLISVRAPIGAINVADCECCIGRGVASLRTKNDALDMNYLRQCLTAKSADLAALGTGSTFTAVGKAVLNSFEIPVYEKEEQREIAQRFGEIIRLQRSAEQMLAKADELIQSRFVEMFGDLEQKIALSHYVTGFTSGKSLASKEPCANMVLKTSAVAFNQFDDSQTKFLPADYVPNPAHEVSHGDVIINRKNTIQLVGSAGYVWNHPKNVYLSDLLWRANIDETTCNPIFLWQLLTNRAVHRQISAMATGANSSMANITKPNLMQLNVVLAPLALQDEFAEFVTSVESLKSAIRQQLDRLTTLYASLTQRYFAK